MHLPWGKIVIGILIAVVSFAGGLWALNLLGPSAKDQRPALVEVPPLKPVARNSVIVTPAAIALTAIQAALETAAPRNLAGKRDNPFPQLLSNGELDWMVARGPLAVAGRQDALVLSTALSGSFRATGQVSGEAGNLAGAIGGLLGGQLGQGLKNLQGKALDQRADIRGEVTLTAHPSLLPAWRVEPNLSSQIALADASLPIMGAKLSVSNELKPFLDRAVNEQMAALAARLRDDPSLELAARREWAKMCRSISLKKAAAGLPDLWLEMRPVRAFAAHPRIEPQAVNLVLGVQAETRVIPIETKPNCPFPAQVDIVPQVDRGRVSIGLAIDVPFTEVTRLLEAQIKGRSFPDDGSGPIAATIEAATVQGAGDRLLIALKVRARETSWFHFGALADVLVRGRATLDRDNQILRLTDIAIDVESEAAMGLVSAAARAALPYLQTTLAEKAVIDLKPFAAGARESIAAAVDAFTRQEPGVRVDAAISDLRLASIELDAVTLRLVMEVNGTVAASVTALPK